MSDGPSPFSDPPGSHLPDQPLVVKCNYISRPDQKLTFRSARNCTYDKLQEKVLPSLNISLILKQTFPRLESTSGWKGHSRYSGRTMKENGTQFKMKLRSLKLSTSITLGAMRARSFHQAPALHPAAPRGIQRSPCLSKSVSIKTVSVSRRPPRWPAETITRQKEVNYPSSQESSRVLLRMTMP